MKSLPLLILLAVLFNSGCSSPEHAAFVATTSITQVADAAIGAFNDYRKTNPVDREDVRRVYKLAKSYKYAVEAARIAQRAYAISKGDPVKELDAKAKTDAAVNAMEDAARNISKLIFSIVPELQKK